MLSTQSSCLTLCLTPRAGKLVHVLVGMSGPGLGGLSDGPIRARVVPRLRGVATSHYTAALMVRQLCPCGDALKVGNDADRIFNLPRLVCARLVGRSVGEAAVGLRLALRLQRWDTAISLVRGSTALLFAAIACMKNVAQRFVLWNVSLQGCGAPGLGAAR